MFWRGADWSADVATRTPSGRWGSGRELIRSPGQRPYLKVAGNGSTTIGIAFTNGHPRNVLTSVYYADYRNGSLWKARGSWITRLDSAPIAPRQADLVYDASLPRVSAWVWDVAFASNGRPVIVYATFPTNTNHIYWYATFDGPVGVAQAHDRRRVDQPRHDRIRVLGRARARPQQPVNRLRLAPGPRRVGDRAVEYAQRGSSWSRATVVPADGTDNVRPVVPRGYAGGPMGLLWLRGEYDTYTAYRTSVAFTP